ncbi:SNF2 family N-terminal domain-containing protein [Dendryphion nanum]|uniref:SNF2 family N-terminal domain-containing protein n=1 Tax=Dendryphion nanum TaxID=256645 RepID=A0A9P9E093_9PLEO|nr:SNF2 family N-terminal domain-containing protein [Dendryphion nanum]
MDPALFLNPRAARQQRGEQKQIQAQGQFDPRALLNPRAPPKRAASEAVSDRGRDNSQQAQEQNQYHQTGQVALVERLHNIQHQRTASPAKRVRTDDSPARSVGTSNRSGGGGAFDMTSMNGNPMPNLPTPAPPYPQQSSIDLTMSDDEDDLKVVKDNGSQVICIGRIKQIYIQSHMVPFPDPRKYRGNNGSQTRIKVSFRRGGVERHSAMIMVVDPTGREFGRVDAKTAQGLAPLMDSCKTTGLQWMAMTEPRRKQPNEGPSGSALSTLIALTLQLYCPRKYAHEIGRLLRTKGIQLIDPIVELDRFDYYNPQTAASFSMKEVTHPDFEPIASSAAAGSVAQYAGAVYSLRSVEEVRNDVLNMFDTIVSPENIPECEPNTDIIKTLLKRHQKQALAFMNDKEQVWMDGDEDRKDTLYKCQTRSNGVRFYYHVITGQESNRPPESVRGGILADEMGLGKTLSILSLMTDAKSMQAAIEFSEKTPAPSQASLVPLFINSRATLLICPLSTMVNWKIQIEEHVRENSIKWTHYHGPRNISVQDLADHDLVITTYQVAGADAFDPKKALGHINFFRIVLDEAHTIRNEGTRLSKGTCALAAQRRWAVTGTPVQNRLDDLGALFKFLRIKPFHETSGFNRFIINPFKAADPDIVPKLQLLVSSVTLRRIKDQGHIDLPRKEDLIVKLNFSEDELKLYSWFENDSRRKVNVVASGEKLGGSAYARILKAILYLRLICAHGRNLLGDEALKLTEGMTNDNPMEVEDDQEHSPALNRKAAFEMLELLGQTSTDKCVWNGCNHKILAEDDDNDSESDSDAEETKPEGRSAFKDTFGFMTSCYHLLCPNHAKKINAVWAETVQEGGYVRCQFCEDYIRPSLFELKHSDLEAYEEERERIKKDPKLAKKLGSYTGPHTKTKALLSELEMSKKESMANPNEPPIKSVVFSSWTSHLDLIQIALENHGHTYTRLDGRMNRIARTRALETFAKDPTVHVMLVSIGAGGLGLNLTSANKVYVMEPQFNPAAEAQAVDRVHRLGQTRPVTVKRFIMDNSFELKMLELQRRKKDLADLTMAREKNSKDQASKKRLEDLKSLFR